MKRNNFKLIFNITFFILYVVVPCTVMSFAFDYFLDEYKMFALEENNKQAKSILDTLRREGSNIVFLQKQLNSVYGMLAEEPVTTSNIEKRISDLKSSGLSFFNFRFFDANSDIIPIKNESENMKVVMQNIFATLSSSEKIDNTNKFYNKNSIKTFLGSVNILDIIGDKSVLISANIKGKPGYFYWNTFYSSDSRRLYQGGMIAWCLESDIPTNFSIKQVIDALNLRSNYNYINGVYNFKNVNESYEGNNSDLYFPITKDELHKTLLTMINSNISSKNIGANSLLVSCLLDQTRILYHYRKLNFYNIKDFKLYLRIIIVVFAISLIKLFFKEKNYFSFPSLLLVLVEIILLILMGLGFAYSKLSENNGIDGVKSELESYISTVDDNYKLAESDLERCYKDIEQNNSVISLDEKLLNEFFLSLKQKNKLDRIYLCNKSGKILYCYPSAIEYDMISNLVKTAAQKIYNEHLNTSSDLRFILQQEVFHSVTEKMSDILGDGGVLFKAFETINRLNSLWLTNRKNYIYSGIINLKNNSQLIMIIWNNANGVAADYLRNIIKPNIISNKKTLNGIVSLMTDITEKEMPFPVEYSKYKFTSMLTELVKNTGVRQSMKTDIAGERYLVVASPLKSINGKIFMTMKSISDIYERVNRLFYSILFLFISSQIGIILAFIKKNK